MEPALIRDSVQLGGKLCVLPVRKESWGGQDQQRQGDPREGASKRGMVQPPQALGQEWRICNCICFPEDKNTGLLHPGGASLQTPLCPKSLPLPPAWSCWVCTVPPGSEEVQAGQGVG